MEHYFTNNHRLKSEFREIKTRIFDCDFTFISDLGVFSKDKIDYGSRLLIETYLKEKHQNENILDVGCGYGVIGITLGKITLSKITMVDINKRALHLAQMNAKKNKVTVECFESDIYSNVKLEYDVIISNPPIRAGKNIVKDILLNAYEHLTQDGVLWFVMRKNHGVKSYIEILKTKYTVEIKKRDCGFYVVCCKKKC